MHLARARLLPSLRLAGGARLGFRFTGRFKCLTRKLGLRAGLGGGSGFGPAPGPSRRDMPRARLRPSLRLAGGARLGFRFTGRFKCGLTRKPGLRAGLGGGSGFGPAPGPSRRDKPASRHAWQVKFAVCSEQLSLVLFQGGSSPVRYKRYH
jgi:hypothetical protein